MRMWRIRNKLLVNLSKKQFNTSSITVQNEPFETEFSSAKPFRDIPGPSFLSMIWQFTKKPELKLKIQILFKQYFETYGPIFNIYIPGLGDRIFIQNPEDAQTLLKNDGNYPIEAAFDFWVYYRNNLKKDMYPESGGLVGSHGKEWYKVRSKVQQDMLRPKSAMFYIDSIANISEELVDAFTRNMDANGEVEDVTEHIYRWSLETIASIFLDAKLGSLKEDLAKDADANKLVDAINIALGKDAQELSAGVPIWKYVRTPYYTRFDKASDEIYNISKKYISEALANFESNTNKKTFDEMSVLEKLIKKCGADSQIPLVMAQDAIAAGIDTTGNTAAFLLYDLARNPNEQEVLFQEIKAFIGDDKITEAQIKKMKYLKASLHESQRLNPAVLGITRRTQVDMVLAGYQIPSNNMVNYLTALTMMEEAHFETPEMFSPQRWIRGCQEQHSAHPFAAIPFSHGPRMCIGRRFAELECYVLVIKLLQKFRLEYHHEPVHGSTEFIVRPDRKIRIKFVQRS